MITHKAALMAADILAMYCTEHFDLKLAKCDNNCIFKPENKRKCCLELFLGSWGSEMKAEVDNKVRQRCEELMK